MFQAGSQYQYIPLEYVEVEVVCGYVLRYQKALWAQTTKECLFGLTSNFSKSKHLGMAFNCHYKA